MRPSTAHAAGRAASEAELVAYATKAAAAAPQFRPGPHEWVYAKVVAVTSANEAGSLQGPITGRRVTQTWTRVDGRKQAMLQHGSLHISALIGSPEGWKSVSYSYLKSLPTEPARLRAIIAAEAGPTDADIFDAVQEINHDGGRPVLPPIFPTEATHKDFDSPIVTSDLAHSPQFVSELSQQRQYTEAPSETEVPTPGLGVRKPRFSLTSFHDRNILFLAGTVH